MTSLGERATRAWYDAVALLPPVPCDERELTRRQEIEVLARTLWGEAACSSVRVKEAVACVVMNRLRLAARLRLLGVCPWWGETVRDVCLCPGAFTAGGGRVAEEGDEVFAVCKRIARRAVNGVLADMVRGATHYRRMEEEVSWARHLKPCASVGDFMFYRAWT